MPARAWILLVGTALSWGSSFMLTKVSLDDLAPAGIAFGRCVLGLMFLWAAVALLRSVPQARRGPYSRREHVALFLIGLMTAVPFLTSGLPRSQAI